MNIPPEDILVTIVHPFGEGETTLAEWIAKGPGPRPFVRVIHPRMRSTGRALPSDIIPLVYQNTPASRHLIRRGLLPNPWPDKAWRYPPEE